jgi:hypothetical protein
MPPNDHLVPKNNNNRFVMCYLITGRYGFGACACASDGAGGDVLLFLIVQ